MDIEKLIEQLKDLEACAFGYHINGEVLGMDCSDFEQVMVDAADALEELQAELNAAKSPEVLEAVDELMEFARTRMSTADWLYYVDVLGGWRGIKED